MQRTFSIIKPDAVRRNLIGHINSIIESSNLNILASKKMYLTKIQAETFYEVHKERPFFESLIKFIESLSSSIIFFAPARRIQNVILILPSKY